MRVPYFPARALLEQKSKITNGDCCVFKFSCGVVETENIWCVFKFLPHSTDAASAFQSVKLRPNIRMYNFKCRLSFVNQSKNKKPISRRVDMYVCWFSTLLAYNNRITKGEIWKFLVLHNRNRNCQRMMGSGTKRKQRERIGRRELDSVHTTHFYRVEFNSIKCSRNATVDSDVALVSHLIQNWYCQVCRPAENVLKLEYSIWRTNILSDEEL